MRHTQTRHLFERPLFAVLGLVVASVVLVGAGAMTGIEDARITARIETMFLLNEHLSPFNINTTTENGVVTLTGSVADEVQRDLAADLANEVEGVKDVVNNILVVDTALPRPPKRSWRQIVTDRTISAHIRSRLLYHKHFRAMKLDVKCHNNAVTLSGVVGTADQKAAIGRIAEETRGVEKVHNNLTVRPKEKLDPISNVGRQLSDEWVEKRVETALMMNRHISILDLHVEVDDDLCILAGTVRSDDQKALAEAIAQSVYGVQAVRNDIQVREVDLYDEPVVPETEADTGPEDEPVETLVPLDASPADEGW